MGLYNYIVLFTAWNNFIMYIEQLFFHFTDKETSTKSLC